jgi:hypothetical protein
VLAFVFYIPFAFAEQLRHLLPPPQHLQLGQQANIPLCRKALALTTTLTLLFPGGDSKGGGILASGDGILMFVGRVEAVAAVFEERKLALEAEPLSDG